MSTRLPAQFGGSGPAEMPALFITATGTDIGKTFVCCELIRFLSAASRPVRALKPIATGFVEASAATSDSGLLLAALDRPISHDNIAAISPWRYAAPLSPNLAAKREGVSIDLDAVVDFCERAVTGANGATVLIEGIGGLMVPLDERHTVLDWIARLRVPALLIAGSYLGALSHTLTCVDVLRARRLPLAAILVNESEGGVDFDATVDTIAAFANQSSVVGLARGATEPARNAVYEKILASAIALECPQP